MVASCAGRDYIGYRPASHSQKQHGASKQKGTHYITPAGCCEEGIKTSADSL